MQTKSKLAITPAVIYTEIELQINSTLKDNKAKSEVWFINE